MKKKSETIDEILKEFMHEIVTICACEQIPEARMDRRKMELDKAILDVRAWAISKLPKKKEREEKKYRYFCIDKKGKIIQNFDSNKKTRKCKAYCSNFKVNCYEQKGIPIIEEADGFNQAIDLMKKNLEE